MIKQTIKSETGEATDQNVIQKEKNQTKKRT